MWHNTKQNSGLFFPEGKIQHRLINSFFQLFFAHLPNYHFGSIEIGNSNQEIENSIACKFLYFVKKKAFKDVSTLFLINLVHYPEYAF